MPNPEMKTMTVGDATYDIHDGRIGNLADLNTTNKSSVVSAINETLTRTGPTDQQVQNAVDDYLDDHPTIGGTFTNEAKNALIALLEKVAYIDNDGQTYLDNLMDELFAVRVISITAVFLQGANVIYDTDSLDTLKQYLVVTANYSDSTSSVVTTYTLSGTLEAPSSTITVTYGGQTDTFTVTVTSTTLWSISNTAVTTSTTINSEVDLISTDRDFSICADISFTAVNGDYKVFYSYENASPWRGIVLGKGGSNSFNIKYINSNTSINSSASSATSVKVVATHVAGSGVMYCYTRWNGSTTTVQKSVSNSFVALTPSDNLGLHFGWHTDANNWAGTINKASIRNFAMSLDQANAYFES